MPTAGEEILPEGWVKKHDPKKGKDYFYHTASKKSQWTVPEGTTVSLGATPSAAAVIPSEDATSAGEEILPEGWAKKHDPKKGKDYYYHAATKKSQWTAPEGTIISKGATPSAVTTPTSASESGGSAAGEEILPEGWVKKHDPKKGKDYYYHAATKKSQWTAPEGTIISKGATASATTTPTLASESDGSAASGGGDGEEILPEGWVKKHDPKKGKDYYYHAATKKSQWTAPEGTIISKGAATASATTTPTSASESGGSAAGEEILPEGWAKKHDAKKGKDYYYHAATKKSQWTAPEGTTLSKVSAQPATVAVLPESGASTTATAEEVLPEGWVKKLDAKKGKDYYFHAATKKSQWTPPEGTKARNGAAESSPAIDGKADSKSEPNEILPEGWVKKHDLKKGKDYYYHAATKKSQWTAPEGAIVSSAVTKSVSASAVTHVTVEEEKLPDGWVKKHDAKKDKDYYYHTATKKSQWTAPEGTTYVSKAISNTASSGGTPIDNEWLCFVWVRSELGNRTFCTLRVQGKGPATSIVISNQDLCNSGFVDDIVKVEYRLSEIKLLKYSVDMSTVTVELADGTDNGTPRAIDTKAEASGRRSIEWNQLSADDGVAFVRSLEWRVPDFKGTLEIIIPTNDASGGSMRLQSLSALLDHLRATASDALAVQSRKCSQFLGDKILSVLAEIKAVIDNKDALKDLLPSQLEKASKLLGVSRVPNEVTWTIPFRNSKSVCNRDLLTKDSLRSGCLMVLKLSRPQAHANGDDTTSYSSDTIPNDVWMSYWTTFDHDTGVISLYSHGPNSSASLIVSLDQATVTVDELNRSHYPIKRLSYPTLNIHSARIIRFMSSTVTSAVHVHISIKFQTLLELWCWTVATANWFKSIDVTNFNMFAASPSSATQVNSKLQQASGPGQTSNAQPARCIIPTSSRTLQESQACLLSYITAVLNSWTERFMVESCMRTISLAGAIVASARFQHLNGRVIFTHKGQLTVAQLIEGSVLISVNNVHASPSSVQICLKVLSELPHNLPVQLTYWKFPIFHSIVTCVGNANGASLTTSVGVLNVQMLLNIENGALRLTPLHQSAASTSAATASDGQKEGDISMSSIVLLITECQFQLVFNASCGGPFALAIEIKSPKSIICLSHSNLDSLLKILIHIWSAAKLLGSVAVGLSQLARSAEEDQRAQQHKAALALTEKQIGEFVSSNPLKHSKSISAGASNSNSNSNNAIVNEGDGVGDVTDEDDSYEDDRIIDKAASSSSSCSIKRLSDPPPPPPPLPLPLSPRFDGFALLEAAEGLKSDLDLFNFSSMRIFPTVQSVKQAIGTIRRISRQNHELMRALISMEIVPQPRRKSANAPVSTGNGNEIHISAISLPSDSTRASLSYGSFPDASNATSNAGSNAAAPATVSFVLDESDLAHCSRIIMHMRREPRCIASCAKMASAEERADLANVLISRVYCIWSSDDAHIQDLMCALIADETARHPTLPAAGRHMQLEQHADGISFSSMLLTQILHRIDVVLAVKQFCDSLDHDDFLAGLTVTASSNEAATAGAADVSEICRRVVEPFCNKLMEFVQANGFPRVLGCVMSALSVAGNNSSSNGNSGRYSNTNGAVSFGPISAAEFLSNCIVPSLNQKIQSIYLEYWNRRQSQSKDILDGGIQQGIAHAAGFVATVVDVIKACFVDDAIKPLRLCLSEQAALSRCKWSVSRCVDLLVNSGTALPFSALSSTGPSSSAPVTSIALLSGMTPDGAGVLALKPAVATSSVCLYYKELRLLLSLFMKYSYGGLEKFSDPSVHLSLQALATSPIVANSVSALAIAAQYETMAIILNAQYDRESFQSIRYASTASTSRNDFDFDEFDMKGTGKSDNNRKLSPSLDPLTMAGAFHRSQSILRTNKPALVGANYNSNDHLDDDFTNGADEGDAVLISELASLNWIITVAKDLQKQSFGFIQEGEQVGTSSDSLANTFCVGPQLIEDTIINIEKIRPLLQSKATIIQQTIIDYEKLELTIRILETYNVQVTILLNKLKSEISQQQQMQQQQQQLQLQQQQQQQQHSTTSPTAAVLDTATTASAVNSIPSTLPSVVVAGSAAVNHSSVAAENELFMANLLRAFGACNQLLVQLHEKYRISNEQMASRASIDSSSRDSMSSLGSASSLKAGSSSWGRPTQRLSLVKSQFSTHGYSSNDQPPGARYGAIGSVGNGIARRSSSKLSNSSSGDASINNPLRIMLQSVFTHSGDHN